MFFTLLPYEQDCNGLVWINYAFYLSSVKITKHIPGQDWRLPWFLQTMAGVHAWPGNTTPLGKISIPKTRWSHLTTSSFWINLIKFVWHGFLSWTVNFWGKFCLCLVTCFIYTKKKIVLTVYKCDTKCDSDVLHLNFVVSNNKVGFCHLELFDSRDFFNKERIFSTIAFIGLRSKCKC